MDSDDFESRKRAFLRKKSRRSLLLALTWLGSIVLVGWGATGADSRGAPALAGLWAGAAGLMVILAMVGWRSPSVPAVWLVFDRPVDRASSSRVESLEREKALAPFAPELEVRARSQGDAGWLRFFASVHQGAARHDPVEGVRCIDEILAAPEALPEPKRLLVQLRALRERFVLAQRVQARFCVMNVTGWSGAVETNLKLFL